MSWCEIIKLTAESSLASEYLVALSLSVTTIFAHFLACEPQLDSSPAASSLATAPTQSLTSVHCLIGSTELLCSIQTLFLPCRLYSSAHFNDTFPEHTPPEILNTSLEGLVLLMKAMHVDKVCTQQLQLQVLPVMHILSAC